MKIQLNKLFTWVHPKTVGKIIAPLLTGWLLIGGAHGDVLVIGTQPFAGVGGYLTSANDGPLGLSIGNNELLTFEFPDMNHLECTESTGCVYMFNTSGTSSFISTSWTPLKEEGGVTRLAGGPSITRFSVPNGARFHGFTALTSPTGDGTLTDINSTVFSGTYTNAPWGAPTSTPGTSYTTLFFGITFLGLLATRRKLTLE